MGLYIYIYFLLGSNPFFALSILYLFPDICLVSRTMDANRAAAIGDVFFISGAVLGIPRHMLCVGAIVRKCIPLLKSANR